MAKKRTAKKEVAGDTLVVYEAFVWNHHKWGEEAVGDPFICPADVPGDVFRGFLQDRLVGPESARKVDELLLASLVEKQMAAKASDDASKFKHKTEEVTEQALKNDGVLKSVEGPVKEVNGLEVIAEAEEEWQG